MLTAIHYLILIGSIAIPDAEITKNIAHRSIEGDILHIVFNDPTTGDRQDIIAAVSNVPDGSSEAVCATGKDKDTDDILRAFEGCSDMTIHNKKGH